MKKFYTFKAGQEVPKWMMDFTCSDLDMHQNKSAKIVFGKSLIAVRESGEMTKLMTASGGDCFVNIRDMKRACVGGVLGASGVDIREGNEDSFGVGLVYSK
jgi:hypothetical protein